MHYKMAQWKQWICRLYLKPQWKEPVVLSDQDKLIQLEQDIADAKMQMEDAETVGDDDAYALARSKAKNPKEGKEASFEENRSVRRRKNVIDQAKIDEVKAKIADARTRRNQAFDDEDDDAEEAAAAEIKELMKELNALTGGTVYTA